MKIGKPFKDFKNLPYPRGSVTQGFGGNHDFYKDVCPVQGKCLSGHNGIDMVSVWGTEILAVMDGLVIDTHTNIGDGYGNYVRIQSGDLEWTYGHLASISVVKHTTVKKGDVIGRMGNTGMVNPKPTALTPLAGTHLHLGCRHLQNGMVTNGDNGYFGSFDFTDMLPEFDPINDDIPGFIALLKQLVIKLQQAGIPLNKVQ